MKLVALGANGRTGRLVLREALERGASVTAVVRSDAKRPAIRHDRLRVVIGDPCDPHFLATTFQGEDAAISTLGGRRPTKRATSIYYRSAEAIARAAAETGLDRIAVTSSALLFPPRRLLDRLLAGIVHNVVHSATRMEQTLRDASLNVTIARCGFLTDANDTAYRAEQGSLPIEGSSISRPALAKFLVHAIEHPWSGFRIYGVSGPATKTPSP